MKKLTSPNMTFPFDYNLLILPVVEEFIVCPTTFKAKNPGEPLSTDLDHKGVYSTKPISPI